MVPTPLFFSMLKHVEGGVPWQVNFHMMVRDVRRSEMADTMKLSAF